MDLTRRAFGASVVGGAAATSGCLGFVLGTEPLSVTASKAEVGASALDTTGYEHLGTDPVELSREITVAGQTRQVELTNYVSQYQKTLELPDGTTAPGAAFAAFATPAVEIAGETLNPLGELSERQIAKQAQGLYGDLQVQEQVGAVQEAILGSPRELLRFAAVAALAGTELDTLLHLATIQDAGDFLFLVGLHPRQLSPEADNVIRLASALTH